jgi:phosphodiesterase/alkaline phosphatase D-like protein
MSEKAYIVKSGTWLYDKAIPTEVWIVKQNFDYYYEEGFEDESEKLNENGEVFQILIARDGEVLTVARAFLSLEEAVRKACAIIPETIQWDDHRMQPLFLSGGAYRLSE